MTEVKPLLAARPKSYTYTGDTDYTVNAGSSDSTEPITSDTLHTGSSSVSPVPVAVTQTSKGKQRTLTYQDGLDVLQGRLVKPPEDKKVSEPETRVYRARWYILFILSLSTTLQNAVWASWGPIAQSAKAVYGWKTSTVAMMINCGNIGVLLPLVLAAYLVSKKGLRFAMVSCTFLLALGAGLRVITMDPIPATILIGAGQFFNGVAGSITQVVPPFISETWFPSNERTTATAIGVLSNALGGAAAFLLGPNIVSQPDRNGSYYINPTSNGTYSKDFVTIRDQIWLLNIIEFSWGAALFVLSFVYHPARPLHPPSKSASVIRPNFRRGFSQLAVRLHTWQMMFICAIPWAVFGNWLSMLDTLLHDVGVSQTDAGWFGFYSCIAGTVGGTILGRIADIFERRIKRMLICLYVFSLLTIIWFTCMVDGYLPRSNASFAVAVAILGVLVNSAMPLNYEISCEMSFPVSEIIVGLFIGLGINATAVMFMLAQLIPNVGTSWMNWCFVGVLTLSIPVLVLFKESYNRTEVDFDVKANSKKCDSVET